MLTVPLVRSEGVCGAITLERDATFDRQTVLLVEAAGALVGAVLDAQRKEANPV